MDQSEVCLVSSVMWSGWSGWSSKFILILEFFKVHLSSLEVDSDQSEAYLYQSVKWSSGRSVDLLVGLSVSHT